MTPVTRTVRKRNGSMVPYDAEKIRRALWLCFHTSAPEMLEPERAGDVEHIVVAVANVLTGTVNNSPGVEDIQRLVIQQLWGRGLFTAAEHYQNYRETRRRARAVADIPPAVLEQITADRQHFPTDLQYYQFMSKFSRWNESERRRETWRETVYGRVMPWLCALPGVKLDAMERDELERGMYDLSVSPAMRVVQMAGPALDRCQVGAFNCAYHPLQDTFAFAELLYILMQGTGAGFSVESEYVSQLPRVKKQTGKVVKLRCGDTTESWCDTFHNHLNLLWDGYDTDVDTSAIRPAGTRLKTKGGRASGPGPFMELLAFSRHLIKSRAGRFLEDIDAHDLACMVGRIVQVGGVRRAAEISLSDLDSSAMRNAKSGNWWEGHRQRSMANNSAVYDFDGPVPVELFMEEWLALVKSKSGERGIFNRRAAIKGRPVRRAEWRFGCNPCAEIILRPFQFCNLSISVARPWDTPETLATKVRLATYFGKMQSMATRFNYIRPDWTINSRAEMLLGVDITGHADCPLLHHNNAARAGLLQKLQGIVLETDRMLSSRWGVGLSAAATTIKPSGDSAVFFDCGSGVSPRFAAKQIRWVRESKTSPVARFLIDSGVPYADSPEAPAELYVFAFPKVAPAGATLRNDMTALEQLENWLVWKTNWAEHSVSATIYVDDHEWPAVGAWVYAHMDEITGVSFLPRDNGTYTYAPNEELTDAAYEKMMAVFPTLNWAKLPSYETEDMTESAQTFACVGGGCS